MNLRLLLLPLLASITLFVAPAPAQMAVDAVIPKAKQPVHIDGRLEEWSGAFATPVNFGHADWQNRAAVWHYLWDDRYLYVALDSLDQEIFNRAPGPIYNGDGVEFYIDTRDRSHPERAQWTPGALHLFYTAASNGEIRPRIQIRGGIPGFAGITTEGMDAAAVKTEHGYTLEFRLPWSKFPEFQPKVGAEIGLDCELCSSDGAQRVDRNWVFSGVAAVGSPAVIGRVRLVETWDPADAAAYSKVLFPSFVARSSPLGEPATVFAGVSPALQALVKGVELSAGGRKLPMVGLKRFGPGWSRGQGCLVGFTRPGDRALEVRFLGDGGRVLGTREIPLQ